MSKIQETIGAFVLSFLCVGCLGLCCIYTIRGGLEAIAYRQRESQMTVQQLTLALADTQYYVDLPANTKGFVFRCRTATAYRFATVTGKVASTGPYMSFASSAAPFVSPSPLDLREGSLRLYFATTDAGAPVIEVLSFN